MSFTTYFSPNQATIAQVETYVFTAPNSIGNTYIATLNGKSVVYTSVSGDTAATVATGLCAGLSAMSSAGSGFPEMAEITFANPSSAVVTATASVPGTPFANVTVNGVAVQGLVLSTGNGLVNGISTSHTQANKSPSDVGDTQNWLRYNMANTPPSSIRSLPQNSDAVVVGNTDVPMLWNLDALALVQASSYTRTQDMTGTIGLPLTNLNGYQEWRAPYFRIAGPQGSVPAGGLAMVLGGEGATGIGNGPASEAYNVGSQQVALTVLAGQAVSFVGQHTNNTFTLLDGALAIATNPGETASLTTSVAYGGELTVGSGVTWTAGATLTINTASAMLAAAPATLALTNGALAQIGADSLTWATVTAQGASTLTWLAGGIITNLTMTTSSTLDKSSDPRALTITNSTIDGDTCRVLDPLGAITFTNATTVKQQVTAGPFVFIGPRTVKVT